jgi:toxin ParE1/3/4
VTLKVELTLAALDDLWSIGESLADGDGDGIAIQFGIAVDLSIQRLADNPGIGAPRSNRRTRLRGLRMMPVRRFRTYLIFYTYDATTLQIRRIIHGARNIGKLIDEP